LRILLVPTLIIVIGTAALGTWLLRQQGLSTLARARSRLDSGELPATQLIEGAILLVGGALLLTPSALKPGSFLAGSANGHNNLVGYGSRVLKFRARSLELALEEREC